LQGIKLITALPTLLTPLRKISNLARRRFKFWLSLSFSFSIRVYRTRNCRLERTECYCCAAASRGEKSWGRVMQLQYCNKQLHLSSK